VPDQSGGDLSVMIDAPPWLRFHAYSVGLPKTGSSSLASVFSAYRTRHEWGMLELIGLGTDRLEGKISDDVFWERAGNRLSNPVLELDVATSHHLYADALASRFEHAKFVHVIRDARSWVNSMLDMGWRMRRARARLGITADDWQAASGFYADTAIMIEESGSTDAALVPGLLIAWQRHLDEMTKALPPGRTMVVRLPELSESWRSIAEFLGADPTALRSEADRVRVAPARFDRFLVDPAATLAIYQSTCAAGMQQHFTSEHEAVLADLAGGVPVGDWEDYCAQAERWVDEGLRTHGARIAY